jgi:hypothetical protein
MALHPGRAGPTDHHLVDGGVAQQLLQRAKPEGTLGDQSRKLVAIVRRKHACLAVDQRADPLRQRGAVLSPGLLEQALAQGGGQLVQGLGARSHAGTRRGVARLSPGGTDAGSARPRAAILEGSTSDALRHAGEIALAHHERWDGSGYPAGLRGDAIPISGRIVALADVFDALTHERPYKPAWPPAEALDEVRSLIGRQFDPRVAEAFTTLDAAELLTPISPAPANPTLG